MSEFVFVLAIIFVLAVVLHEKDTHQKLCDSKLDINAIETLLSYNVFGQEQAMRTTAESFRTFYSTENAHLQILVFSGAIGVGKTFTASLLSEAFPWKLNIHHFLMPIDFEQLPEIALKRHFHCGDHLVIMDDLREEDTNHFHYLISYLRILSEMRKVTVVLIFKFHWQLAKQTSQAEISEKANVVQTYFIQRGFRRCHVIDFKTLEEEDAMQCVREALKNHNIPVYKQMINTILKNVDYNNEGCKRISSKVALFSTKSVMEVVN